MLSINWQKSLHTFAAGLGIQLSNIDIQTRISKNKRGLIDHCLLTSEQMTSWKICLPPFDFNDIFFQSKLFSFENERRNCSEKIAEFNRIFSTMLEETAPTEIKLISF